MNQNSSPARVSLFLCGDVMSGRGIDQILPHPVSPELYEPFVRDARDYVTLAEQRHGSIPRKAGFRYVWGDALTEFERWRPEAGIINLETSVTGGGTPWPGKGIHYRMHPGNAALLKEAPIDVCSLANNHVLDWGHEGLEDTLETLRRSGLQIAGAGRDAAEAAAPAVLRVPGKGRVVVVACGVGSSGIPAAWAASAGQAGVNRLPELSAGVAEAIGSKVRSIKGPGDVAVASIHWGGNWGFGIPSAYRQFAHLLIDHADIDLLHGHSSHHVKGIEVYRGKLILYGCGDLLTDYEGISGHEAYRGDLGLMYFARLQKTSGRLARLDMVPMTMQRFQLRRASRRDAEWLRATLDREGRALGTRVAMQEDGTLLLDWAG